MSWWHLCDKKLTAAKTSYGVRRHIFIVQNSVGEIESMYNFTLPTFYVEIPILDLEFVQQQQKSITGTICIIRAGDGLKWTFY